MLFHDAEWCSQVQRSLLELHGLILGSVLAVAGFDPRLAVLPSLLAWAGLLVGVVVSMSSLFAPEMAKVSIFALMAIVLIIRPQGFFGLRERRL